MNSVTEYLTLNVYSRRGFVNITSQVEKIVQKSGIKQGNKFSMESLTEEDQKEYL